MHKYATSVNQPYEDEPRYHWQDLDLGNVLDVKASADADNLFGIVDVVDGGIIAYAIGLEHAQRIIDALNGVARL